MPEVKAVVTSDLFITDVDKRSSTAAFSMRPPRSPADLSMNDRSFRSLASQSE